MAITDAANGMTMDAALALLASAGIPARKWIKRDFAGVREARIYLNDGPNAMNRGTGVIFADRATLTVSIAAVDAAIAARR